MLGQNCPGIFYFMDFLIIIFIFLLGMAFGSFFNVCIYRLPRKESLIFPNSHCPHCNVKIKPYHNIPIVSFLLLKGKCADCGAGIHWHYFLVELITPLLFIAVFLVYGLSLIFLKYLIFFSAGIVIFFVDVFHQIIPDRISLPLIVSGLALALLPQSDVEIISSLAGAVFGFLVFWATAVLFEKITKKEGLGGGDIKLITAIGAYVGLAGSIFTIIVSSFLALTIMIAAGHDKQKHFAFGSFLISGAFIYIIFGNYFLRLYLSLF